MGNGRGRIIGKRDPITPPAVSSLPPPGPRLEEKTATCIYFEVPMRIESTLNLREHWGKRNKRKKYQQRAIEWVWVLKLNGYRPPLPAVVTMTRIAPRPFDTDNLAAAMKGIRDKLAILIGLPTNKRGHAEDSDPKVTWKCEQLRRGKEEYALAVEIRQRKEGEENE